MTDKELRDARLAGMRTNNFGGNTSIGDGFEIRTNLLTTPAVMGFQGVAQETATGNIVREGQAVSTNTYNVKITNKYAEAKRIALFSGNLPKELVYYNSEQKGVDAIAQEGKFLIDGIDPTKYLELSGKFNFDKYVATLNSGYVVMVDRVRIKPSTMEALDVTYHIEYNRLFDTNEKLSFEPSLFVDKNQNQDLAEIPLAIGRDAVCLSPMTTWAVEVAPLSTVTITFFATISHSNLDATLALARSLPKAAL